MIRFDKTGNELTLIIHSIGDLGLINEAKFNEIVETLTKALTKSYGTPTIPVSAASVIVRAKGACLEMSRGERPSGMEQCARGPGQRYSLPGGVHPRGLRTRPDARHSQRGRPTLESRRPATHQPPGR